MAIFQAYQADVLKEMAEGGGLTPEAVKELGPGPKSHQTHGTGCRAR